MKRYSPDSADIVHDLIIAGGGIYGASMAYTAAVNGIKTVVLEKEDFASSASANSQKVIHGGLRYLQTMDIKRVVESIRERQRFYRLFPHLVKPLPCVLPTTGWGTNSNEAFRIAFLLYKLIQRATCRTQLTEHQELQPRLLSKNEVTSRFPHLRTADIRGGALWYDGLCIDPERLILSLLKTAANLGSNISNYTEIKELHRIDDTTLLVTVYDHIHDRQYQLKTRKVTLCTGSWFKAEFGMGKVPQELEELTLIRGMNVLLPALFESKTSLAAKVPAADESRMLFIVPWKQYSIGGTHWQECDDPSSAWTGKEQIQAEFHQLMKKAVPNSETFPDIVSEHVGFVPGSSYSGSSGSGSSGSGSGGAKKAANRILSHYRLVDREDASQGDVLQVVGVKFTTAFDVVFKALKHLFPKAGLQDVLECDVLPCGSPTKGSHDLLEKYHSRFSDLLTLGQIQQIFSLFGTELPKIADTYLYPLQQGASPLSETGLYQGLTTYCVQEEMTLHLHDLIFRRLFPDSPHLPSNKILDILAGCMAKLLMWSPEQTSQEVALARKQRYEDK